MLCYIDALCDTCECAIQFKCDAGWTCAAKGKQFCFVCGYHPDIGTCSIVCDKLPPNDGDCNDYRKRQSTKENE